MSESNEVVAPFIPIWLEACNLTPHQYRITCHLWHRGRGRCYPSMETIAGSCRVNLKTAKRTIRELEVLGLVHRQKRKAPGVRFANEYILTGPKGTPVKSQPAQKEPCLTGPNETPPNRPKSGPKNVPPLNVTPLNDSLGQNDESFLPMEIEPTGGSSAESIYQIYPRKKGKKKGLEAIRKALKKNTAVFLTAKVKEYAETVKGKDPQFIPYPATWFNEERFSDEPETPTQTTAANTQAVNLGLRKGNKSTL